MSRTERILLRCCSLLALACLLLTTVARGAWGAAGEENPAAEALISRARMQQALWNDGTPPMSLRAQLQARDVNGKMVEGAYTSVILYGVIEPDGSMSHSASDDGSRRCGDGSRETVALQARHLWWHSYSR